MKNLIKRILNEETKSLLTEGGIRDIKKLAKRYKMAKIYFHLDLDGVTTALAMKHYLERNGIKVVDAEPIQYGAKEFAVKKPDGEGEIMPVLVDFAHGKPMFVIHTDHHDTQAGVEGDTSTNFKSARSNVETISQSISPSEIFPPEDVETISIVDSADFAKHDIKPRDVINYLFQIDRTKGFKENKRKMGFVANKLLLAFKNKPNFLSDIVLNAQPSLLSILMNIKDQIQKKGYATLDKLEQNKEAYIESRKKEGAVEYSDGVISQYGFGSTMKPGSYDRYTPFENYPDADFLVTGMHLGMVQASCNPYKKDRALKGVNLGEVKDEVLDKMSSELESIKVTFGDLKRVGEQEAEFGSVGFTLKDFMAIYGNAPSYKVDGGKSTLDIIGNISQNLYRKLSDKQRDMLDKITVNGLDVIKTLGLSSTSTATGADTQNGIFFRVNTQNQGNWELIQDNTLLENLPAVVASNIWRFSLIFTNNGANFYAEVLNVETGVLTTTATFTTSNPNTANFLYLHLKSTAAVIRTLAFDYVRIEPNYNLPLYSLAGRTGNYSAIR